MDQPLTLDWAEIRYRGNCKKVKHEDQDCRYKQVLQKYLSVRGQTATIARPSDQCSKKFMMERGLGIYNYNSRN
jgi:hypothetical protein